MKSELHLLYFNKEERTPSYIAAARQSWGFYLSDQTVLYCPHQFTSVLTLHSKVEHAFIQISRATSVWRY